MTEEEDRILGNLLRAVQILEGCEHFVDLIPEVRINIAYALETAGTPREVAAVDGRITTVNGRVKASGRPRFGASDHMARLLIEMRKREKRFRAGMNFAWTPELSAFLEGYAARKGWGFAGIDRSREPEEVRNVDRMSTP